MTFLAYPVLTDAKGYHFLADVRKLKANTVRKSEKNKSKNLAERGFDLWTSRLWAQHASTAPLCSRMTCIEMILNLNLIIWLSTMGFS